MLERARKPRTEAMVNLCFSGPARMQKKAVEALRELGFTSDVESIPASEVFKEFSGENKAPALLRGARYKEGMTQVQLAAASGIPQRHISAMENGKEPIGKERAKRIAKVLNVDYRVFL